MSAAPRRPATGAERPPPERSCDGPRRVPSVGARLRGRLPLPPGRRPADGHRRPGRGRAPGRPLPDARGDHRQRQDGHHRLDHRGRPAPDPDHRAQQVPGRPALLGAARAVPQEPGRVLRLLLRLLPARGLPPHHRHLHREGLLDQRRDRPAAPRHDVVAAHAARRDRGGLGLVHLRAGLARGVPRPDRGRRRGRGARPAGAAAAAGRPAVRAQRHEPGPRHLPGPGRHGGDPSRLRGARRCGSSSSATPSSGSSPSTC